MRKTRITTTFDMKINTCRYFYFLLFLFLSLLIDVIRLYSISHFDTCSLFYDINISFILVDNGNFIAKMLLYNIQMLRECEEKIILEKLSAVCKKERKKNQKTINIPQSMNSKNMRRSCKSIYFYTREDPNKRSIIVTSCYSSSSSSSHSMYI